MSNIVQKPWGHEVRWAITDKYLGKILHINAGHKLSRQYHELKDESIYAPSSGCILVEVSTPEIDDVVRLEDEYNRK